MKISDIDKQIADLQAQKLRIQENEVKEKKKNYTKSIPEFDKKVAVLFHDIFCHSNHTDACSWGYECNDDPELVEWKGWAHSHYLEMSRKFIKKCPSHLTQTEILAICYALKESKR